ncbi:hypothetical protein PR003_g32423 [Phytophthora rubi]|uniref:Uncharacterized protein n=1 Tax=Phytophthora rubi TaxID=129364 RepID=A0A6A4AXD2_9STRA|nr:hypothetical protein PR003_g32423 [Phytophthora rubi]
MFKTFEPHYEAKTTKFGTYLLGKVGYLLWSTSSGAAPVR